MKKVTVLIPCHNEEKGVAKILDAMPIQSLKARGLAVEVLVIDNNSTDATAQIALDHGARVIAETKQGKGSALMTGFRALSDDTDYVVMMDGDNTYKPHELMRMLEPLESDFCDVVIGSRLAGKTHKDALKFKNRFANWFYTFLVRQFYFANITDVLSGYFAWKKSAVDRMMPHLKANGFAIEMEMITKMVRLGLEMYSVPITYDTREGETKLNAFRDGLRILGMFARNLYWNEPTGYIGKDKPKVAVFVSYAYPFTGSGIGNVAKVQAEHLAKRGYQVTLVSSNHPHGDKSFIHNDVIYQKIPGIYFLNSIHVPVPLPFFTFNTIRTIKNANIVHIHGALYPTSWLALFWAKLFHKPVILTQHVPFITYPNPIINLVQALVHKTVARFVFTFADTIIVLNKTVEKMLESYAEKVTLIPNGVDTDFFHPVNLDEKNHLREKYHLPTDIPIVLFVGRMVPKKGFDLVHDARDERYLTVCIGAGVVPEYMQDSEHIVFLGSKEQEELREFYQLSDILLLPSYGEGFPLVVQEAMASGLAIITTAHPDYHDYLDARYVQLIERSVPAIQQAVNTILDNLILHESMKTYSRKTAKELFSWEDNVHKVEAIYMAYLLQTDQLLSGKEAVSTLKVYE